MKKNYVVESFHLFGRSLSLIGAAWIDMGNRREEYQVNPCTRIFMNKDRSYEFDDIVWKIIDKADVNEPTD